MIFLKYFMADSAIYFSICHKRNCCHGNHIIDRYFSENLYFQLVNGIVLLRSAIHILIVK